MRSNYLILQEKGLVLRLKSTKMGRSGSSNTTSQDVTLNDEYFVLR